MQHLSSRDSTRQTGERLAIALAVLVCVALTPLGARATGSDNCVNATAVSAVPYTDTTDNTAYTTEGGDPSACLGSQYTKSYWYHFTAPEDGLYLADTDGAGYDTVIAVYKASTGACGALTSAQLRGCNDQSALPSTDESMAGFAAAEGEKFLIEVMGSLGGAANSKLNIDFAHETTIAPVKGFTVKIPEGAPSVIKVVKVKVKNSGTDGPAGHVVQLRAAETNLFGGASCGATLTTPDLDKDAPGAQDTITLAAGKKVNATFELSVFSSAVYAPLAAPMRCTFEVYTATGPLSTATDLKQADTSDDSTVIVVDVIDKND